MQRYNISSVTCDINQFSNGVAAAQRPKLCSCRLSDPPTNSRHRTEPHPVVLRGGGGYSGGGGDCRGGGGGGWFSFHFDCSLLSVERPPGSLGGGFSPVSWCLR